MSTGQASSAVHSLDGRPIGASHWLLISLATESRPRSETRGPFLTAPATGVIEITAPAGLALQTSAYQRSENAMPRCDYRDGIYRLNLDGKAVVQSLVLKR